MPSIDLKISTKLFAAYRGEGKRIDSLGLRVGMNGTCGMDISMHHPAETGPSKSVSKISGIAKIADMIDMPCMYYNGTDVYVRFTHHGDAFHAHVSANPVTGLSITYAEPEALVMGLSPAYELIPAMAIYAAVDKEFSTAMGTMLDTSRSLDERQHAAYLACDSFYFGFVVSYKDNSNVYPDGVVLETMEKGVESGEYKPFFFGITPEEASAEDEKPEKPALAKDKPKRKAKAKAAAPHSAPAPFDKDDAMDGAYFLPIEWSEEQKGRIPDPSELEGYVVTPQFIMLFNKIRKRMNETIMRLDAGIEGIKACSSVINCILPGRPGTGKTELVKMLAATFHVPLYVVVQTPNTEEDTYEGLTMVVDGKLTFVGSSFLEAWEKGGIVVLEEINLVKAGNTMGALGQALEKPYLIMKDGYVESYRNPHTVVFATMNVGTAGSQELNDALASRFSPYLMDDPSPDLFIKILESTGHSNTVAKWVYSAYDRVIKYLTNPDIDAAEMCGSITLRSCLDVLERIDEGLLPKDAAKAITGQIGLKDPVLAGDVYKMCIDVMPDLKVA